MTPGELGIPKQDQRLHFTTTFETGRQQAERVSEIEFPKLDHRSQELGGIRQAFSAMSIKLYKSSTNQHCVLPSHFFLLNLKEEIIVRLEGDFYDLGFFIRIITTSTRPHS